ncbi:MAG: type II CRISPR RNA-guided endonuclease Cas9 [Candidatus Sabulitectum sp.]|nr:type II CRISPR RNA-guided endonuclease Cas9 [Candidatus Sabulitectum sp.]
MLKEDKILGLDLGTNSLGWALLGCDPKTKEITGLIDAGSRVFEAGMDGDISSGRAESRCAERRSARSIRRNLERRRRRMRKVKNLLQEYDLLPEGDDIEIIILNLDKQIREFISAIPYSLKPDNDILAHTYPYFLRALATEQELPQHFVGRAIYHLAQRRGFWSNRKSMTEEKELGQVKQGIADLQERMDETGTKTLGQYFAFTDPTKKRIRGLWTSRKMYQDEFKMIIDKQQNILSKEQADRLEKAIFFQRKLKSQKSLIGKCSLEKNKRRCSWYRREAQEFRYLQNLNNLRLITHDGELRELNPQEHDILLEILSGTTQILDKNGNISMAKAKKILGLHKKSKFTIEEGGEKTLKGDKTTARVINAIGADWLDFSPEKQERIIHDLNSFEKTDALKNRALNVYNLSDEKAEKLSLVTLEPDYCNHSLKAIKKLLPLMRSGLAYAEAVKEVYPDTFTSSGINLDILPQLNAHTEDLRNPVVERCLNELRQVVNAIIKQHGKPGTIRLELAREMKNTKKQKQKIITRNRDREKERNAALAKIQEEFPTTAISRDDITKILLAEECGYICPYTGEHISIVSLIGRNPKFDIEHIIPRSRSMDNSFINKTLCLHHENRNVKKNRTPYETYHGTDKFDDILLRVASFKGNLAKRKLELFNMTPEDVETTFADFSNRQLNDTRYASKEAAAYLGLLYGGLNTSIDGKRRVNVLSGGLTALVRSFHGLNAILNDGDTKSRDDHRHHAVDAIAIGVTSPGMVKQLSDSIRLQELQCSTEHYHTGKFKEMKTWPAMFEESKAIVRDIITSHHVSKKIRGGLHKETFYSKDHGFEVKGKLKKFKHVPVELPNLERKMLPAIVDDGIRRAIESKLDELQIDDPKKAFRGYENMPELISKDGNTRIPIKKVKIRRTQNTIIVGKEKRQRNVVSGNNHHMLIYAELDKNGNETKWVGEVVTLLEATERLKNRQPIVNQDVGSNRKFIMSIKGGDVFEMDIEGARKLVITRIVPQSLQLSFARINDARLSKDIKASHEWFSKRPNTLKTSNPVKLTITPLGNLRRAND